MSSILDAFPEYDVISILYLFVIFMDFFFRAEKSPEAKEQFLRQLENIDVSVKQTLDKVSVSNIELCPFLCRVFV